MAVQNPSNIVIYRGATSRKPVKRFADATWVNIRETHTEDTPAGGEAEQR